MLSAGGNVRHTESKTRRPLNGTASVGLAHCTSRRELTEQLAQVVPEVFVHERIDEWISDVIGEVHIEDSHVVRH